MEDKKKYKQLLKNFFNSDFKIESKLSLKEKLETSNNNERLDLIVAKNKIEELILSYLQEVYSSYISAKEISFLLGAGKNIAYEEEDILVYVKISKARKKFIPKSLLNLIRIKNCHEIVLKNLIFLIEKRRNNINI